MSDNEPEDISRVRTQGHANTNFIGASRDLEGERPIKAHAGQRESENAKREAECRDHPIGMQRFVNLFSKRLDARDAVSYTHLDVYKRQFQNSMAAFVERETRGNFVPVLFDGKFHPELAAGFFIAFGQENNVSI